MESNSSFGKHTMMNNRKFLNALLENILWPLRKQQGFALIWLCTLLPIILMASIFVYVGTIQIEMRSTLHQLCRSELITAQAQSSQIIQKIMVSNSIKNHHKKNFGKNSGKSQESLLRTSLESQYSVPWTLIDKKLTDKNHADSILFNNLSTQELLDALTKHSKLRVNKGKSQIQKALQDFQQKLAPLMDVSGIEVIGRPHSALSIQKSIYNLLEHSDSISLKENFEKLQSLTLSWKYQLKLSPNFIIANSWSQNFEGHCSATLKKEKPWLPILYEDKFFWKPS